jgi:hypothetical protein
MPYERIEKDGVFYIRVKKPDFWELKESYSEIGEKILKIIFYAGF